MILPVAGIVGFLAALGGIVLWFALTLRRKEHVPGRSSAVGPTPILPEFAITLEDKPTLREMFDRILESLVRIPGVDCGGVYVVRESDGALDLVAHRGLSESFVVSGRRLESGSPRARSVMTGIILMRNFVDIMRTDDNADMIVEGLRSVAVVPLKHEGRVVAALNVGSHSDSTIPTHAVKAIEKTSEQLGGIIARLRPK